MRIGSVAHALLNKERGVTTRGESRRWQLTYPDRDDLPWEIDIVPCSKTAEVKARPRYESPDNLQLLCSHCNRHKGEKAMVDWKGARGW